MENADLQSVYGWKEHRLRRKIKNNNSVYKFEVNVICLSSGVALNNWLDK